MPTDEIFLTFAELEKAINNSWNSCFLHPCVPKEIMWQAGYHSTENVMQWVLAEMPDEGGGGIQNADY